MNRRKLHDYILHFKSGLFAKNNFEDWIWETQFKIEYFYNLTDLKSAWNNHCKSTYFQYKYVILMVIIKHLYFYNFLIIIL